MINKNKYDLKERTFNFSKASVRLVKKLPKDFINEEFGILIKEAHELTLIFSKMVITAKSKA